MGGRNGVGIAVVFRLAVGKVFKELLHRLGEAVEFNHVIHQNADLRTGERLVVREKRAGAGDIGFGLAVNTGNDGVVGPLKQKSLAISDELDAFVFVLAVEIVEAGPRKNDGGGDVVFDLDFLRGTEIGAELVDAPGAVAVVAHAKVIADERLVVELELVAEETVNTVNREVLAPIVAPFGPVVALDGEQELANGLRQTAHPFVVRVGVLGRFGEQADDRAHGSVRSKDGTAGEFVGGARFVDQRKVALEDFGDLFHVLAGVADVDRAVQQGVGDGFRDFGFSSAGNGAGLVAQNAARARADQPPGGAGGLLFQVDAEARGHDVNNRWVQGQVMRAVVVLPADQTIAQGEHGIFGEVEDVRIAAINRVAFRLAFDEIAEQRHAVIEGGFFQTDGAAGMKIGAENIGGESDGAAGVFFFGEAE